MSIQSLPIELVYQVFQYLTYKSIAKFSYTSHFCNIYSLSLNEILCLYTSENPFNDACEQGYLQILKIVNNYDYGCIIASRNNEIKCLEILIKYKANINYQDNYGVTALHWASFKGFIECIEILLKNGANINIQDNDNFTVLHWASLKNNKKCLQILLDYGADPNIQTNEGNTALHWACINGHVECVQSLINHGIDIDILNYYGKTALHYANCNDYKECVDILKK